MLHRYLTKNLIVGLGLALVLSAPVHAQTTLTMATGDAVGSLRNQVGNYVRDELASRGGSLRVNHIEGPVLGNAAQIRDQVAEGSVDIMGTDAAWLTPYSDFLKATSFAFIFRSEAHLNSVFASDFMRAQEEEIAQKYGVRVLASAVLPSRAFFLKIVPTKAADFVDLKIRSPQLNSWLESYKSIGANPTPVSWNEVFLAIQTGLVDGGHGLPADILPNNWHMAAPNIVDLEDMFAVHVWFINEAKWQSLSDAEKAELTAVLQDSVVWMKERADATGLASVVEMLQASGGTYVSHNADKRAAVAASIGADRVVAFPEAELAAMQQASQNAARALEGTTDWWGKGLVDEIQAIE